jgi:hypothetical protein
LSRPEKQETSRFAGDPAVLLAFWLRSFGLTDCQEQHRLSRCRSGDDDGFAFIGLGFNSTNGFISVVMVRQSALCLTLGRMVTDLSRS